MVIGQWFYQGSGRARSGHAHRPAQGAGCDCRPLQNRYRRKGQGGRSHRGGPETGWASQCLCRRPLRHRSRGRIGFIRGRFGYLAVFHWSALPRQRPTLHRPDSFDVFFQFGGGCLRNLPGFWSRDWRGLRFGHPQPQTHLAGWGHQNTSDARLARESGRPDAPRRSRGHSA